MNNKKNKYERIFDYNNTIKVDFFEQLVKPTYIYCKSKNNFIYVIEDKDEFTFIDTSYNILISIPLEIILDIAKNKLTELTNEENIDKRNELYGINSTLVSNTLIENKPIKFDMVKSFKTNFPDILKK